MTHVLTVLGTTQYSVVHYTWQSQQVETCFAAEAIAQFFAADKVTVLLTAEAKQANWDAFQQRLGDRGIQVINKAIPSGQSESEIWQIFDSVVDAVAPKEQVIFDITNAFRSIPILVLLAAAFLQKARDVKIRGVYYGAFEVDRQAPPIFDLTPAVRLLDWLTATNQFIATGSSVELARLLSTLQQDFDRSHQSGTLQVKPIRLKQLGQQIERISQSIDLIRSRDLLTEVNSLQIFSPDRLRDEVGAFAKPFELLLEQIQQDYGQFGLTQEEQSKPARVLQKQFLLLQWYVQKQLGTQAILLAREWIISVLCVAEGWDYSDRSDRETIAGQLRLLGDSKRPIDLPINRHVREPRRLAAVWRKLKQYRDDIAHPQMTSASPSSENLQLYVQQELLAALIQLFSHYTVDKNR